MWRGTTKRGKSPVEKAKKVCYAPVRVAGAFPKGESFHKDVAASGRGYAD